MASIRTAAARVFQRCGQRPSQCMPWAKFSPMLQPMKVRHRSIVAAGALAGTIGPALPVYAAPGDQIVLSEEVAVDSVMASSLHREKIDRRIMDADALTLSTRAGAAVQMDGLSLAVDGEGRLGVVNTYSFLPSVFGESQPRFRHSEIADPMTVGLKRLQLQYRLNGARFTLGRQPINLYEQRWAGSEDWHPDQTFDAVRAEARFGSILLDGVYAFRQRPFFGIDAAPRQAFDGTFLFASAGSSSGPLNFRAFAYRHDQAASHVAQGRSQTYGARASSGISLAPSLKLNLGASYARQAGSGANADHHAVDHVASEVSASVSGFSILAGYEKLGSKEIGMPGGRSSFSRFHVSSQTPMAALHRFNGRADVFVQTPAQGLRDYYAGMSYDFRALDLVPGLNASLTYHKSASDRQDIEYGSELEAGLGFKLSRFAVFARYADHDASDDAPGLIADNKKVRIEIELAY